MTSTKLSALHLYNSSKEGAKFSVGSLCTLLPQRHVESHPCFLQPLLCKPKKLQEAALTSPISIYKDKVILKGLSQNSRLAGGTFQTSASLSKGCFFSL